MKIKKCLKPPRRSPHFHPIFFPSITTPWHRPSSDPPRDFAKAAVDRDFTVKGGRRDVRKLVALTPYLYMFLSIYIYIHVQNTFLLPL